MQAVKAASQLTHMGETPTTTSGLEGLSWYVQGSLTVLPWLLEDASPLDDRAL